ncbi:MAG: PilW family protein [Gammaproteobacteria bacterium]
MNRTPILMRGDAACGRSRQRGINLIELMIAMVLGLLVVGGAVSIFVANQHTTAVTESLGRIQENTRTAFELMARELREAGGNPCGKNLPFPANVLNNPTSAWWSNWGNGSGLQGFDDAQVLTAPTPPAAGLGARIPGTDAVDILSAAGSGISVQWPGAAGAGAAAPPAGPPAAALFTNTNNHGFQPGDILLVCDLSRAAIFQMTAPAAPPGTNNTIVHGPGGPFAPGNCTQGLGSPVRCSGPPNVWAFGQNSNIARLAASRWYIGNTARLLSTNGGAATGRALFRATVRQGVLTSEEVAEGVTNMQITYLLRGANAYVPATAVPAAQWGDVTAINITLALAGQVQNQNRISTTGNDLQRQVNYVVNLRNRSI